MKNKAIFLDKDGIINKLVYNKELGIIHTPLNESQVKFTHGLFDFLLSAKKSGYLLIIISNQPNIGINKISQDMFLRIRETVSKVLKRHKIILDAEYYCLHHPFAELKKFRKKCKCRKPKTYFYEQAIKKYKIDISKSWSIGDGIFDIEAGNKMGIKTILVSNLNESVYLEEFQKRLSENPPTFIVRNLNEASKIINNI